jgi:uncharacterized protein (DUF736 family)
MTASLGNVTRSTETGAFKGELRTPTSRRHRDRARRTTSPRPPIPTTASIRTAWTWGPAGSMSVRPRASEYVGLTLAHPDIGPRAYKVTLGRAAGQDDDDVFALIWNPED